MTSRVFAVFLGFALCTSLLVAKMANADETPALATSKIANANGRLLAKKSSVDRLWTADKLNNGKSNIWAMGWPILGGTSRRAVGGIGGGRSAFFVCPDDNVAVILMTNMVGANPQNMIDTDVHPNLLPVRGRVLLLNA